MRYWFHVLVIVFAGCLGDTVSYSPQEDDDAINAIVYQFSAPGTAGLTVALCEDVDAVEDTNNCQVQHTVRGGGRGRRHEEDQGGVGCGGCPFATVAFVTGTVSGGSFTAPQKVKGEVTLGYGTSDDPYAFPYRVTLTCEGTPGCYLTGMLEEDGSLEITTPNAEVTLVRGAEASCP
jgi:hypothetical protein